MPFLIFNFEPETTPTSESAEILWQGLLFCKAHFQALFWKSCSACQQIITGEYVDIAGQAYHHKCICCSVCKIELDGDTKPVIMLPNSNALFCENDARDRMLDQQCGVCQQGGKKCSSQFNAEFFNAYRRYLGWRKCRFHSNFPVSFSLEVHFVCSMRKYTVEDFICRESVLSQQAGSHHYSMQPAFFCKNSKHILRRVSALTCFLSWVRPLNKTNVLNAQRNSNPIQRESLLDHYCITSTAFSVALAKQGSFLSVVPRDLTEHHPTV